MISQSKARPVKSWNPEPFVVTKGRVWLFSDEKSWKRFQVPFFSFSASAWPWPMRNKHFAFFSANQCVFLDIPINSIPPVTLEMLTRFNLATLLHQFLKLCICNDFTVHRNHTATVVGCCEIRWSCLSHKLKEAHALVVCLIESSFQQLIL